MFKHLVEDMQGENSHASLFLASTSDIVCERIARNG